MSDGAMDHLHVLLWLPHSLSSSPIHDLGTHRVPILWLEVLEGSDTSKKSG